MIAGVAEPVEVRIAPKPRRKQKQSAQRKRRWTLEEDSCLLEKVKMYGTSSWVTIAQSVPNRTAKQCRERWSNNLRPDVNPHWTEEDEVVLINFIATHGRDWRKLSLILGKTANWLKNRYYSLIRKQKREDSTEHMSRELVNALERLRIVENSSKAREVPSPLSIEALLNKPLARRTESPNQSSLKRITFE